MCALCRRSLLAGERYRHWAPGGPARGERIVCGLCEAQAGREGWVRAARPPAQELPSGLRPVVRLVA